VRLRNEIIIAAAGGGKTTRIVKRALGNSALRSALLTYTKNNVLEIEKKIYGLNSSIPPHIEVWSWFSFLLRELARPYQLALHDRRIDGIHWVEGRSVRYVKRADFTKFYFSGAKLIYSDKLARFIYECNKASEGAVIKRLEQRFDEIYIDEIQDMAGYDFELIELILRSKIKVILVGDHRQATFRTNNAAKNKAYLGIRIIDKFKQWHDANLGALTYERETYRCHQSIADLADSFFPSEPRTVSRNEVNTEHDGVFVIHSKSLHNYLKRHQPQILRLNKSTLCEDYEALNYGESKGLTFERVLIFPHKEAKKWLSTGDFSYVEGSAAKMYVGITRARHSVTFVFDGEVKVSGINKYDCSGQK
jgi:DNA helicase II / ATP-dependent DNA helicase PcrA